MCARPQEGIVARLNRAFEIDGPLGKREKPVFSPYGPLDFEGKPAWKTATNSFSGSGDKFHDTAESSSDSISTDSLVNILRDRARRGRYKNLWGQPQTG